MWLRLVEGPVDAADLQTFYKDPSDLENANTVSIPIGVF